MVKLIKKPQFIDETGDPIRRIYHYGVHDPIPTTALSPSTAIALVEAALGPTIITPRGVLFRGKPDCRQTAWNMFDVDIEYITRPKDMGTWFWEFDGQGVVENTKTSLEEVAQYPATPAIPSNNLIGLDESSREVQGAEVLRPGGRLVITFSHPAGVMTIAYGAYLASLIGCYNLNPWLQWQGGEVRFEKPRVSDGSQADATAVYEFQIQKNKTSFAIGGVTGITKLGWHVIDVRTKRDPTTTGGSTYANRNSSKVYIHRVSEAIDFATAFGIA